MSKSLDSSAVFRQENYQGIIKDVSLVSPSSTAAILSHILEEAKRDGYKPEQLAMVNVVRGSPERDEPCEAILCEGLEGRRGIILKRYLPVRYEFYSDKDWRYAA